MNTQFEAYTEKEEKPLTAKNIEISAKYTYEGVQLNGAQLRTLFCFSDTLEILDTIHKVKINAINGKIEAFFLVDSLNQNSEGEFEDKGYYIGVFVLKNGSVKESGHYWENDLGIMINENIF